MDHYKNLRFTYGNTNQPHTLTAIGNGLRETTTFQWDANGNMRTRQDHRHNPNIWHCWDEENRLQGVRNAQMAGYYQYDAQGERTYKSSYEVQSMMVNGHTMLSAIKPLETLYASPYMVGTRYGYTKHYFAGAERIASKTGTGGLADINQPVCTAQQLTMKREQNNILEDIVLHGCLQFANVGSNEEQLKVLHDLATAQGPEQECYWYHPDHIGSTAWVSGVTGTGIEHRCYLPFGEPFVTQPLPGAWNPRYTFSGKERDEETGYSYFGARYYQPNLSIWLSVDPMSDKYPSLSPYAYCGNNPVRLVDPDGSIIEFAGEEEKNMYNQYKQTVQKHIDQDKNNSQYVTVMNELNEMETSKQVFTIRTGDNIKNELKKDEYGSNTYDIKTNKININVKGETGDYTQTQVLAHELKHGYQYINGEIDFSENGLYHGALYDCTDERAAFERANLFSIGEKSHIDINSAILPYKIAGIPQESRSYQNLDQYQKMSYDAQKKAGKYH